MTLGLATNAIVGVPGPAWPPPRPSGALHEHAKPRALGAVVHLPAIAVSLIDTAHQGGGVVNLELGELCRGALSPRTEGCGLALCLLQLYFCAAAE